MIAYIGHGQIKIYNRILPTYTGVREFATIDPFFDNPLIFNFTTNNFIH